MGGYFSKKKLFLVVQTFLAKPMRGCSTWRILMIALCKGRGSFTMHFPEEETIEETIGKNYTWCLAIIFLFMRFR